MSYSLSFAEDFFIGDERQIETSARPTNVYQAIVNLRRDAWREIAREVFDLPPERVTPEMVLACVVETNTCSNLDEPVEVWIHRDETTCSMFLIQTSRRTTLQSRLSLEE
jgi:hypothetical protein